MNAPVVAARPSIFTAQTNLRKTAIWLAVGLLVLGLLFHQEIAAAVAVWASSTAYNHCFLVLPIAAYLVWDRHEALRDIPASPVPMVALAGIPVAVAWLAAERLGIMEGRQLAAMSFVELLFLAVLGWRLSWAVAGPLLYLYFLVPFGAFITPKLQVFTTDFVQVGLNLLQIPVYIDGYTIEIPQGSFYIAEACAGLRFLIASIAFGALYALVMYRSPVRRGVFLFASLTVPVIANGFRALGIVVLGHLLGSAQAAATDHVLYGWLFFSIVILILIALGLPFREDQGDPVAARPGPEPESSSVHPGKLRNLAFAVVCVCLVSAISPAFATALQSRAGMLPAISPLLDFGPDCTKAPESSRAPLPDLGSTTSRVVCNGLPVQVRMVVLSPYSTAAPLFATERRLTTGVESEEGTRSRWVAVSPGQPRIWKLLSKPDLSSVLASAIWINGKPAQLGLSDRLRLAWTSVVGAPIAPVLMTVTPEIDWSQLSREGRLDMERRLGDVVRSWPDLTAQIRRMARHG